MLSLMAAVDFGQSEDGLVEDKTLLAQLGAETTLQRVHAD